MKLSRFHAACLEDSAKADFSVIPVPDHLISLLIWLQGKYLWLSFIGKKKADISLPFVL
jgi:hypothetical protein